MRDAVEVAFERPPAGGVICYTLNGSDLPADSLAYEKLFKPSETTTVKAHTFLKSGRASDVSELKFQRGCAPAGVCREYCPDLWPFIRSRIKRHLGKELVRQGVFGLN